MKKKRSLERLEFLLIIIFMCFISVPGINGDEIIKEDYKISLDGITKTLKMGNFFEVPVTISNKKDTKIRVVMSIEGDTKPLVKIDKDDILIDSGSESNIKLTIFGENIGSYNGVFSLSGDIIENIPLSINVTDITGTLVDALLWDIKFLSGTVVSGTKLKYEIGLQNLLVEKDFNITLEHTLGYIDKNKVVKSFIIKKEDVKLNNTLSLVREFEIPKFLKATEYVLSVEAEFLGLKSTKNKRFYVKESVLDFMVLGIIPLRWIFFITGITLLGILMFLWNKHRLAKKKRYVSKIDFNELPKPGPRSAYIGKIAETDRKAYFDIDQLTTHTLIAGSTGGGKTVSAEVLVEEALLKGVSVIVFDPTAQWTGFLRKNIDKGMFSAYGKFGMRKTDAKAFNGNIRQIFDAREIIEIKKYIKPGEINIFSISKLDPGDIDILVTNTIREVFHENFPEEKELKLIIIFDEVHRLLPKFGGSGQGFIQIERAAREFRKWGVGLVLISQVLTDFIGETKANINTEIQMRTRDQGDLDRIKNKYGGYMLQSLLKSATGTGMMENSAYNKGNPYFVSFRPLLHEHSRLTDEELGDYNKFNNMIDDLDYQIKQLEEYGIDIFEFRLEIKMALDKVKSGSFNMVNIYLDGLTPKIKKEWEKLGKQPKKKQIKLVSEEELAKEFEIAKKERENIEGEDKATFTVNKGKTQLEPLKLEDGTSVSSIQELLDTINVMDEEKFKLYMDKKIFIEWIKKSDENLATRASSASTKEEIIEVLEDSLTR